MPSRRTAESKRRQRRRQALRKKLEQKKRTVVSHSSQSLAVVSYQDSRSISPVASGVSYNDSRERSSQPGGPAAGPEEMERSSLPGGPAADPEEMERSNRSPACLGNEASSNFGSPSEPPSTHEGPGRSALDTSISLLDKYYYRESVDKQDTEMLSEIEENPLSQQCEALKHLFLERTKVLHICREEVDELRSEREVMARECGRQVEEVRKFWRDKVYSEGSRSGKLLKAALQK